MVNGFRSTNLCWRLSTSRIILDFLFCWPASDGGYGNAEASKGE
jgi:hypothetical protein